MKWILLITQLILSLTSLLPLFAELRFVQMSSLTSIRFHNEHTYELWTKSDDYEATCNSMLERTASTSPYSIIHSGVRGGFGHKFISIFHSLSYALITGHYYQLDLSDMYWTVFDNCFQNRRYPAKPTIQNGYIAYPNHETLTSSCVYENQNSIQVLMGNRNIASDDCRLSGQLAQDFAVIRSHLSVTIPTFDHYTRLAYRILLNPIPSLRKIIRNFRIEHFRRLPVVGIQIRTGGCISDYPEKVQMMLTSELEKYPAFIYSHILRQRFTTKPVLFVSTDSLYAFQFIHAKLHSHFPVVAFSLYNRSHTEFNPVSTSLYSAVTDIHLLARSNLLFICKGSGFGVVAKSMVSDSTTVIEYEVHRRIANFTIHSSMLGSNTSLLRSQMCNGIEFKNAFD